MTSTARQQIQVKGNHFGAWVFLLLHKPCKHFDRPGNNSHSYINLKNLPHTLIQVSLDTMNIYSNKSDPYMSMALQYLSLAKLCCREMRLWTNARIRAFPLSLCLAWLQEKIFLSHLCASMSIRNKRTVAWSNAKQTECNNGVPRSQHWYL